MDTNGRTGMYQADNDAVALEILEARGEHLVARSLSRGRDLAEPQRARLQHIQDEGGPGPPQDLDGLLKGLTLRVDRLLHALKYGGKTIQRKVP